MKLHFAIFLFSLFSLGLQGQKSSSINQLNISYYGAYAIQPGVRVSTNFALNKIGYPKVFIETGLSYYIKPGTHYGFVAGSDLGWKFQKEEKRFYWAPSLGLNYMAESKVLSKTYNLGTGELEKKNRELYHFFLPAINLQLGQAPQKKVGWFTKFGYGFKLWGQPESSAFFSVELGLIISLKPKL
jgi:hypothetical protein